MLFPLGTDRPLRRPTRVTYALIGINLAIHIWGAVMERASPDRFSQFTEAFWLDPQQVTLWGLITYQFLHGGLAHLLGNLLFLYVFGPNVEDRLTRIGFLVFYLLGGAAAGAMHMFFADPPAPVIGASGSIAAVTGAYLVLFPRTYIKVLLLFIVIGIYEWPATWFLGLAIARDIYAHAFGMGGSVALLAHIGGYLFGAAASLLLLWTKLLPREAYDLFSIGRHANRRRQFRELTSRGAPPWRAQAGTAQKPARAPKPEKAPPGEELRLAQAAGLREEIAKAAAAGRPRDAANAYIRLLDLMGEAVMSRDLQLVVANELYASGRQAAASAAYEAFLKRYPDDREATDIRLLAAAISARYLNDPIRAKELIAMARKAPDAAKHASLIDSLSAELG